MSLSLAGGSEGRRSILDAARQLVMEKGFSGTTVDDILKAANATKGKFFHYFASKDALFEELIREALSSREYPDYQELLKDCNFHDPFERLLFVFEHILSFHKEGVPCAVRLCFAAIFFFAENSEELKSVRKRLENNTRVIESLLQECVAAGTLPSAISPNVLAMFPAALAIGGNVCGNICEREQQSYKNLLEFRNLLLILRKPKPKKSK